jgi:acyl-CoA synthetase (NDP forming)
VGRILLWNLISNPFGGTVYPVNLKFGYPVVLKLLSATISHTTDVGGVQLNLARQLCGKPIA